MKRVDHLRILGTAYKPWITIETNNDCKGIQCDLVKYLSRSLNFTYEFIKQGIGTGSQLPNGSWSGCVGRIERDEADMSGFPFVMSKATFVDQSSPYYFAESLVLTRFDQSWTRANFNELNILDMPSWSLFSILFPIICAIIITLDDNFLIDKENIFQRISDVIFHFIGMFLQKDIQFRRIFIITVSSFILLSSWLISAMQLSLIISSDITALFSLKIPCKQIDTLNELLDAKLSLVVYSTFFQTQNIQDKNVVEKITQRVNQEHSMVEIVDMIKDKKYILETSKGRSAIFMGGITLKNIVNTHSRSISSKIKFRFLGENFRNPFLLTIATSTRLPKWFRVQLNLRVSQYLSSGLIDVQLSHILALSEPFFDYKQNVGTYYESLTLDVFVGFFMLILLLWTACLVLLFLERLSNSWSSNHPGSRIEHTLY